MSTHATVRTTHWLTVCLLALAALAAWTATAAASSWAALGPEGGSASALAISPAAPRIVYAGARYGGVFKSTDRGISWTAASAGLTDFDILTLAVDPTRADRVYAGTRQGGLFRSTDGGASWTAINAGIETLDPTACCPACVLYPFVDALTVDPRNPRTLFAVAGDLYRSTDGGDSWSALGQLGNVVVALAPSAPRVVYLGGFGGLQRSPDHGTTWVRLIGGPSNPTVVALAVDPTSPATVHGAFRTSTGPRLMKSTDSGRTWRDTGFHRNVYDLVVSAAAPRTVYAAVDGGVLRSIDGGDHWQRSTTLVGEGIAALAIDPATPSRVYAASGYDRIFYSPFPGRQRGVLISTDSGLTWSPSTRGFVASREGAVAAVPGALLAALTGGGLLRSADGGASWQRVVSAVLPLNVYRLVTDPRFPSTVYAATASGVFHSIDGGITWKSSRTAPFLGVTYCLWVEPASSVVWAGSGSLFRSADGGDSWRRIELGNPSLTIAAIAGDPSSPATLFVSIHPFSHGPIFEGYLLRSVDGGATWAQIGSGLAYQANSLVVGPSGTLHAGTSRGLYRSTDGGVTWALAAGVTEDEEIDVVALDPLDSAVLWAGGDRKSVV